VTIRLHPVRPNPALGTATLRLDLPRAADADVRVFDASGRQVRTVLRGRLPAGSHPLTWDGQLDGGRAAGAGIYWIRARADGREMSERVVLAR
jgi:flagellar hook assembly protein FlgD